jgi:LmbE family N-acetylglucosaminyl deacetylase
MRVLVIAPHPDDETLGCGGSLLKHIAAGDSVSWAIVTRGHEPQWSKDLLENKEQEIKAVHEAYNFEHVYRMNQPTTKLDSQPHDQLIANFHQVVHEAKPDCIYLNHCGDVHTDHRIIFDCVMSAIKPFNSISHGVKRILSYETPSSTDAAPINLAAFRPNVFTNITKFLERKLEIMSLYESEIQEYPLPRSLDSLKALARYRGATIGVEYAESFMLLREVN